MIRSNESDCLSAWVDYREGGGPASPPNLLSLSTFVLGQLALLSSGKLDSRCYLFAVGVFDRGAVEGEGFGATLGLSACTCRYRFHGKHTVLAYRVENRLPLFQGCAPLTFPGGCKGVKGVVL